MDPWGFLSRLLAGCKALCFAKGTSCRKKMGSTYNFQCEKCLWMLSVSCFFFLPVLKDLVSLLAFKNEERMPLQGASVFVFLILSEVLIYSAFSKRNDSVEFYSLA